jgi:hypothetical protein
VTGDQPSSDYSDDFTARAAWSNKTKVDNMTCLTTKTYRTLNDIYVPVVEGLFLNARKVSQERHFGLSGINMTESFPN